MNNNAQEAAGQSLAELEQERAFQETGLKGREIRYGTLQFITGLLPTAGPGLTQAAEQIVNEWRAWSNNDNAPMPEPHQFRCFMGVPLVAQDYLIWMRMEDFDDLRCEYVTQPVFCVRLTP